MEMRIDVFCMRMIVSTLQQTSVAGASLILLTAVCSEWLDKSIQRVASGTQVLARRAAEQDLLLAAVCSGDGWSSLAFRVPAQSRARKLLCFSTTLRRVNKAGE